MVSPRPPSGAKREDKTRQHDDDDDDDYDDDDDDNDDDDNDTMMSRSGCLHEDILARFHAGPTFEVGPFGYG